MSVTACVCVCVCVCVRVSMCKYVHLSLSPAPSPLSVYKGIYVCMQRGWKNKHRITLKTVDSFQLLKGDKSDLNVNLATKLFTACEAPARPEVWRESFQPKLLTLSWPEVWRESFQPKLLTLSWSVLSLAEVSNMTLSFVMGSDQVIPCMAQVK